MDGEGGAGGNGVLRALLEEAGMSNAGLARAVVSAAAREGMHLATSTTSVRRMLDGTQPRWPVPRLVAAVLSRRLQCEVGVTGTRWRSATTFRRSTWPCERATGCMRLRYWPP